ncbi:MAG TPA: nitrate reductase molybdenum cofactor assembly chaperone [Gammaproteobacteria bacterium]|nr:nitrate reductase molybdenum cofactor assembly chaperone [Gammaproteobacteria bacterium]
MKILKVIALMMHYPDGSVSENADEAITLIRQESRLASTTQEALVAFIRTQQQRDLLDLQSDYGALFDRGSALSLHLFEHVHGESRDRGQAMVELLNVYRQHGFDVSANELPDYVPLFLEFCSLLQETEAQNWLRETGHLLQTLHGRLEARESSYAVLFQALLELGELPAADEQLRHRIDSEERDDTPQALDRAWAEEPVIFGPAAGGCGGATTHKGQAVPIDTSGLRRTVTGEN